MVSRPLPSGGELNGSGLILSLLVLMAAARRAVVEHRSVHTGEVVKIVQLDIPVSVWEDGVSADGTYLEWREGSLSWEDPLASPKLRYNCSHTDRQDGSASKIIASLPTVTPVEPPRPAV
jgi:hypothetical protein